MSDTMSVDARSGTNPGSQIAAPAPPPAPASPPANPEPQRPPPLEPAQGQRIDLLA